MFRWVVVAFFLAVSPMFPAFGQGMTSPITWDSLGEVFVDNRDALMVTFRYRSDVRLSVRNEPTDNIDECTFNYRTEFRVGESWHRAPRIIARVGRDDAHKISLWDASAEDFYELSLECGGEGVPVIVLKREHIPQTWTVRLLREW